jgi:hypothetical protein
VNVEYLGTSYADLWASYHKKLEAYETYRRLVQKAGLYASACYHTNCKADDALNYADPDPAVSPFISAVVSRACANRLCSLLSPGRYQEYVAKHPNACVTDPDAAVAAGQTCPEYAMGITHDEIRAKRDRIAWHGDMCRAALVDYLHRRGIDAHLMPANEIEDYINYCIEQDAGDPLAYILMDLTAPGVPDIVDNPIPTGPATTTPTAPTGGGFSLSSLLQYVTDPAKRASILPGVAIGAALFLLKPKRKATP